jgi:hypothetical protein
MATLAVKKHGDRLQRRAEITFQHPLRIPDDGNTWGAAQLAQA